MIKKHNIVVIVNNRLMELSQDVGFRPIVFIRFNQDGYKITSCWYINKLEIYQINNNFIFLSFW